LKVVGETSLLLEVVVVREGQQDVMVEEGRTEVAVVGIGVGSHGKVSEGELACSSPVWQKHYRESVIWNL